MKARPSARRAAFRGLAPLAFALAGSAHAQDLTVAVAVGQEISPGQTILRLSEQFAVADDGRWTVLAAVDGVSGPITTDPFNALLSDTGHQLAGDLLAGGLFIVSGFLDADISGGGTVAAIVAAVDGAGTTSEQLVVDGVPYASTLDSLQPLGYSNTALVERFADVKVNDRGSAVVLAIVTDPAFGGTGRTQALLRFDAPSAGGVVVGERIVDQITLVPGQSTPVEFIGVSTGSGASAPWLNINDLGQVTYTVRFSAPAGGSTTDAVLVDQDVVLTPSSPAPVAGRAWSTLLWEPVADLSSSGTLTYKARLDESDTSNNAVLVVDDEIVAREGESLPAFAPFVIPAFALDFTGRVAVGDSRLPVWTTDWDDPDPDRGRGLLVGRELVVEQGVSTAGGRVLTQFYYDQLAASESGRYVAVRSFLSGGIRDALVLADASVGSAYCDPAQVNSTGAPARAFASAASGLGGFDVRITAGGLPPGATALLLASPNQGFVPQPGGSQGDLCLGGPIFRLNAQMGPADGSGATSQGIDADGILGAGLVPIPAGETWNFQYWYRDSAPGPTSNFSSAVSVAF
ncbi:MAG: hypothetical protein AAFU73_17210 [Planctomycetota bacterium]